MLPRPDRREQPPPEEHMQRHEGVTHGGVLAWLGLGLGLGLELGLGWG